MKRTTTHRRIALLLMLLAAAGMASSPLASPVINAKPFKPTDAVCWVTPDCAVPRGGDADVMTIYRPDGSVLTQIFAFGHEDDAHLYYFDAKTVPVDLDKFGHYTALLASGGQWDEAFGIFKLPGHNDHDKKFVLGFTADPQIAVSQAGFPGAAVVEQAAMANPVPLTDEPGNYLSVPYDATPFLSPAWRDAGYRAEFRTAVPTPEPGSLALVGTGLAAVMVARHHKEEPVPPAEAGARASA